MGRWGYDPDDSDGSLDLYFRVEDSVRDSTHDAWEFYGSHHKKTKISMDRETADCDWLVDRAGVVQRSLEKGFMLYRKTVEGARDDLRNVLERDKWFEGCRTPVNAKRVIQFWLKAFERLLEPKNVSSRKGVCINKSGKKTKPPKPHPEDRVFPPRDWPCEEPRYKRQRKVLDLKYKRERRKLERQAEAAEQKRLGVARGVKGPFVAFVGGRWWNMETDLIANGNDEKEVLREAKSRCEKTFVLYRKSRGALVPLVHVYGRQKGKKRRSFKWHGSQGTILPLKKVKA